MVKTVWLAKIFKKWQLEAMPVLQHKNQSINAQRQFLKKSRLTKAWIALVDYSKFQIKSRTVKKLFDERRNTLTQTMVISAWFETMCETKLKVEGFR